MINLRACSALLVLLGFGAASSVDVCSNWMVAPSSCPEFTGATIKGKEDRSSAEILSGINFAGSVSFEWKASNATIALPNATRFTLSLSGDVAPPKGGDVKMAEGAESANIPVMFTSSGGYKTAIFIITDSTGACPTVQHTFKDARTEALPYVFDKGVVLIPFIIVFIIVPLTQNVFFGLGFAAWLCRTIIARDPWIGFLDLFGRALNEEIKGYLGEIMIFMFLLGGVVGGCVRSGGIQGLGEMASAYIKDSFLAMMVTYLLGWAVFCDDYANTVIVGSVVRGVTDKMHLSREKLSFIVDCTSSPIAGLMPLSTWIAYELTLIRDAAASIGYTQETEYIIFISSIGKRFYAWFMLFFVFWNCVLCVDWGPMYVAEKRARAAGDGSGVVNTGDKSIQDWEEDQPIRMKKNIPARWFNAFIPFVCFIGTFLPFLFYAGVQKVTMPVATCEPGCYGDHEITWDSPAKDILANANNFAALRWAAGVTLIVQIVFYAVQYDKTRGSRMKGCLLSPAETIEAQLNGSKLYLEGIVALLLAFTYATAMRDLGIATFFADALGETLTPTTLPTVTFILCSLFALSTGTSWGTMGVFFPIAFVLAQTVTNEPINSDAFTSELETTIAAVLGGAIWGDHCSPVSDTTILSAMSSQVPLWDHAKTQLPYAFVVGVYSILFGYLPAGAGAPGALMIIIGFFLIPVFHLGLSKIPNFGGPIEVYCPEVGECIGEGPRGVMNSIKKNFKKSSKSQEAAQEAAL
ncbi:unnamed protein product [Polarella glacialis]|uniref:Na+/H+ antiporter NhaC-like C-terminal domain-containing protein n=1 Tax=Polarella glacialis TaxID=89957 RepID=A0A813FFA7_POLGL|nr:unnamed protein product [Polarella glacialis]